MQKSIKKNVKGITLIALVVTIVILLILAGVSLNLVLSNNGIVNKAKDAKIETKAGTVQDERDMWMNDRYLSKQIGETPKTMEEILAELEGRGILTTEDVETIKNDPNNKITIGSKTISFADMEIGDYVNYKYDTVSTGYALPAKYSGYTSDQTIPQTTGLKWRILNINEDGSVDLISATPTDKRVYFREALGYNNGVYVLNDICEKLYSNSSLGTKAKVRSITIEDIEARMNDAGIEARDAYTINGVKYGETKTYTSSSYRYYPNLYAQEKGAGISSTTVNENGIGVSDSYYTEPTDEIYSQADSNGLTITQTYHKLYSTTPTSYFDDSNVYSMIFGTGTYYWLASRYSLTGTDEAWFGLQCACDDLYGDYLWVLYYSRNVRATGWGSYLRPLVSLSSDLIDIGAGKNENGAWQIKTK